jgi:hypothetical protein
MEIKEFLIYTPRIVFAIVFIIGITITIINRKKPSKEEIRLQNFINNCAQTTGTHTGFFKRWSGCSFNPRAALFYEYKYEVNDEKYFAYVSYFNPEEVPKEITIYYNPENPKIYKTKENVIGRTAKFKRISIRIFTSFVIAAFLSMITLYTGFLLY